MSVDILTHIFSLNPIAPDPIAHRTTGVRRYISFGLLPNVIDAVPLPMLLKMFNILYPNPTDDRLIDDRTPSLCDRTSSWNQLAARSRSDRTAVSHFWGDTAGVPGVSPCLTTAAEAV